MAEVRSPVEGLVAQATRTVLASLTDQGVPARYGLPGADGHAEGLRVWPLALLPEHTGVPGTDLLRLRVRFLVAGDGSADSLEVLDRALVLVAGASHIVLVPDPLPVETWSALGVRPSVAAVLDVPVRVPRPVVPQPRVTGPLRVADAPMTTLRGRVLAPGDIPVPEIEVRVVALNLSTRTGGDGSFVLAGLPAVGRVRLEIAGKGLRLSTEVDPGGTEPLVLRCQLEGV